jgi:hydrogenase expression/formation protein HypE
MSGGRTKTSKGPVRRLIDDQWTHVLLSHGGGGMLTDSLLGTAVFPKLKNAALDELLDSAVLEHGRDRIALTIDSYVVQPIEFPGGDIGRIAVSGTVNDLCVCGARPLGIALSFILAEGLPRTTLERIVESISATAKEAGVSIVTGDTKVVGRGQADGLYITTAGVGVVRENVRLHPSRLEVGDAVLINGPIGEHGLAVMLAREMPQVSSVVRSDVAPLSSLIHALLDEVPEVVFMRDPTRAGLSGVLTDLATRSGRRIVIDEPSVPVRIEALHAAEMLGLDVLEVANEGKVVVVVRGNRAEKALEVMRRHPLGRDSAIIGRVESGGEALAEIRTSIGGRRVLLKPYGEQLPRIC